MRYILSVFILCVIFDFIGAKAQVSSGVNSTSDTLKEKVVFEYDTVYLPPDTIKHIDTIENIVVDTKKKKSFKLNLKGFLPSIKISLAAPETPSLEALFPGHISEHNWSVVFSMEPFRTGIFHENNINDSLAIQRQFNTEYNFGMLYHKTSVICKMGIGYSYYHEQMVFQKKYYTTDLSETGSTTLYDSLLVSNKKIYNDYFNLISLNIMIGREWSYRKICFDLAATTNVIFPVGFSALQPSRTANSQSLAHSMIQPIIILVGLTPILNVNLSKRLKIYFGPFFSQSIRRETKYPYSLDSKSGINIGFRELL